MEFFFVFRCIVNLMLRAFIYLKDRCLNGAHTIFKSLAEPYTSIELILTSTLLGFSFDKTFMFLEYLFLRGERYCFFEKF